MDLKSLVLAAGKGTRMKSELPKVLHKVNGKPMVRKIVDVLKEMGSSENILILGHMKELIIEEFGGEISYVVQEEQLGTGHAIMMAEEALKDYDGDVLIVCGDTPLLTPETLKNLYEDHKANKRAGTILTSIYEDPFGYGRIVKVDGTVQGIVEEKDATDDQRAIKEVNAGVYCFNSKKLFAGLKKIDNNNKNDEYYLTDVIKVLGGEKEVVGTFTLEDNEEILGVNSKVQLAQGERVLRERKNKELMEQGVIIIDPRSTYIEDEVEILEDTTIYPGAHIQGKTKIGRKCEILGDTRIIDSVIGDNVRVERSVVEESQVEDEGTIGPYAHLRPKTHLKKKVHIGNFVETKGSTLEEGVKAGHLSYLGNAQIGEKTNIGAGTITCNYDGKNKHKTKIGKEAFIGSSTMLVAPVEVGDNALIGAGSVITKDVPSNALAVARGKQIIKKEWGNK